MSGDSNSKSRNHLLADSALMTINKYLDSPEKIAEFSANFQYGITNHEICNGNNANTAWQQVTTMNCQNELLGAVTEWRIKFVENATEWADITSDISNVIGMVALNDDSLIPDSTRSGYASVEEIQSTLDANPWLVMMYFISIADRVTKV